jgi:hypothetical protein
MRWPLAVLDEIDRWASVQPDRPRRVEAILRLVQKALANSPDKAPHHASDKPVEVYEDDQRHQARSEAPAPVPLPKGEIGTQRRQVEGKQTTREARWTPRLIETTPPPVPAAQLSRAVISATAPFVTTPKAQPDTTPVDDNRAYEMPEDINAFKEYWIRAEHMLGRHLEYEQVVVSYNRYRQSF